MRWHVGPPPEYLRRGTRMPSTFCMVYHHFRGAHHKQYDACGSGIERNEYGVAIDGVTGEVRGKVWP